MINHWKQCTVKAWCIKCQNGMGYGSDVTAAGLVRYEQFKQYHTENCGDDFREHIGTELAKGS